MAEDLPLIESLFDFFYLDNTKISSFYAQLSGNGAISSIKQAHKKIDIIQAEGTVGLPAVTGGRIGGSNTADTSSERQYDAQNIMPTEMINRLDELGFIGKTLESKNLGRLVLLQGNLGVVDVGMIKEMIEPAINFYYRELQSKINQVPNKVDKAEFQAELKELKDVKTDLIQFAKSVPFAIQGRFLVHNNDKNENEQIECDEVWMTLNRDELVSPTNDVNFKHGEFITGKWYLLGVLDALPFDDINYNRETTQIDDAIKTIVNGLREFVGRPKTSFGITPIAIFRNIEPHLD